MRLSCRIVTCSVAALVGAACSGTTVTQGERKADLTAGVSGMAGAKQTVRSGAEAGNSGRSGANFGGNPTGTSSRTEAAGGAAASQPSEAAGGAPLNSSAAGGTVAQLPVEGTMVSGAGRSNPTATPGSSGAGGAPVVRRTSQAGGPSAAAGGVVSSGGSAVAAGSKSDGAAAGRSAAVGTGGATGGTSTRGGTTGSGGTTASGGSAALGGSVSAGGTTTSSSSTATPPPSITTISPSSGIVTTTVVITGQNFGSTQGTSTVTIAASPVTPSFWSNTSIEVPIPRTIYPGSANITVTVGGKTSNSTAFDVLLPRTIYINKSARTPAENAVSAFSLTAFGTVKQLPNSPYATGDSGCNGGSDSISVAVHRATRRLFVLNDYSVAAFDIDPVTGQLTRTPNSPVSTGAAGASGLVVNAAGTLVFVANVCSLSDNCRYANASISAFKVSTTGVLSLVSGSPFPQDANGGGVRNPALIHGEQMLVVTSDADRGPPLNLLVVNTVDSGTGTITPVAGSPFGIGTRSWSGRADPTGMWYYLSDTVPQLTGYAFQNSGAPALISGMPIAIGTTSYYPNSIAISPSGSHLYMGSYDSNELSVFALNAGSATLAQHSPYGADGVSAITVLGVSRNGSQLVIADATTKKLMVYPINSGIPNFAGQGDTFDDVGDASGLVVVE